MTGLTRIDRAGVAWLELDRPGCGNALTTALLMALRAELTSIQDDPAVRVVVLTGAGEVFCGGADVKEFDSTPPAAMPSARLRRLRLVAHVLGALRDLEQPSVAAVNGAAVGAGWGLALACDLCFITTTATFCLPEVEKGYRLPGPLVHRLSHVVGPIRAAEIMFGGARYSADQAVSGGWATRVLPDRAALTGHTQRFAAGLAARPRAALAAATQPLRRSPIAELSPPPEYVWNEE